MTLAAVTSTYPPRPSTFPWSGGKEELRASCLRPYLLRLRSQHDEEMVRAFLATAGLSSSLLDDDNAWISVAAARRALTALERTLGEGSIESCGEWITHPEHLAAYLRMLRSASTPLEAYRYLAMYADQHTRVGTFDMEEVGPCSARITYEPLEDDDSEQDDPIFCRTRHGLLRAIPRIWGYPDAIVREELCIARGDDACVYEVAWPLPCQLAKWAPWLVAAGGLVSGAMAFPLGGLAIAALTSTSVSAASFGVVKGLQRLRRDRAVRTFEKNRIAALERSLGLRDDAHLGGDLAGLVLGGKYRILGQIGAGGSGAVYAAEHIGLGANVAVKVLRGAAARNASEVARLRREAQVQMSIEHPNVVRTFDFAETHDGSIYVVMELLRGESLAAKMARDTVIAPDVAVPMFLQACRALSAAHERGIVHRDMKPGNVFLCEDGTVKLLDFGMSKFADAESLTREGHTLGTPEYMAPEQCVGAPVEPRTDVYSLGVLMYEALTGQLPIRATNRRDLLELHPTQPPVPMRDLRPELPLPSWLDDAVMKALEKHPEDRPTARELERMLRDGALERRG